ncbi:hypothetical protein EZS27_012204 [termite gut metagenome]|uniref:Uncharacterized protein n=1 Tax=termite gut metagenome TaxID=433724 RepID=A0A5J4S3J6_9ZZZZ
MWLACIASDYWKPYESIIPKEKICKRKRKRLQLKDIVACSDIFRHE